MNKSAWTITANRVSKVTKITNAQKDWNPKRFDRLKNLESVDAYPQVYVTTLGKLDVLDGRHRISVAASQGKSIKVATPKKTVIPHELLA